VSSDLSVEGVHFRRAWLADAEIGYRAAAAALSDLAAMAAEPVGVLVSLAGSSGGASLVAVHAGVAEAARSVGAAVLGGDTSASPGPLIVDVVAVGRAATATLRSGARSGDELWVTGELGGSAAALEILQGGGSPGAELRDAFARPVPRVSEARWLAERGVLRALIDLSDGLVGDAGHLAAAGDVRIVLDGRAVPVAAAAATALGPGRALDAALYGGEDYELCFAAPAGSVRGDDFRRRFDLPLTRVGTVEAGAGVWLRSADGRVSEPERSGFDHFAGPV
jgi:thiamine-monophosphate kinase